jgi:hypothetical protein
MPGFEFADAVARLVGTGTVAMIANHGEELLGQTMLSVPELAMYGEARLRKFATEFVHFEDYLVDGDDRGDDEPAINIEAQPTKA